MSNFTKLANSVFAPINSDGTARQISPQDAQRWGTELERIILGLVAGALDIEFPYGFIPATNSGGGTANAIRATTALPIPTGDASALIALPIVVANTGPATVRFGNGGVLPIRTVGGEPLKAGDLTPDMVVAGYVSEGNFRLITDPNSLVNKLAAEAAQAAAEIDADRAEAARDVAAGYVSDIVSQGNVPIYATVAGMAALEVPAGISAVRLNGFGATGDMGEGALYTDVDNGTPPVFTSGGATGRNWFLAKGQNDVRALGASASGNATSSFAAMDARLDPFDTIEAVGDYTIGDLQLYNKSLKGRILRRAAGAESILRLGNHVPGWRYPSIKGIQFEGAPDQSDLANAGTGVNFTAPAFAEYAGRWKLERLFFQNLNIGIRAGQGNIGNIFDAVSVQHCNYGFYGYPSLPPADPMQPGCQIVNGGEWSQCRKAAFFIEGGGPGVPNSQNVWNDCVIETNQGFGVVVKDYGQSIVPMTFNTVHFEQNGMDPTPIQLWPGGPFLVPCDTYFLRVPTVIFNQTKMREHVFEDSNAVLNNCSLWDVSKFTVTGSGGVRAINVITLGFQGQPVLVESYSVAQRQAGPLADAVWMPPRDNLVNVLPYRGQNLLSRNHSDPAGGNFSGSTTVPWTSTTSGGSLYDRCAEFTLPPGATISLGNFTINQGLTAMYAVEARRLSGAQPVIEISGNGSVTGNLGTIFRDTATWFTAGGIARAASDLTNQSLLIRNPSAAPLTMRLGAVNVAQFFSMGDAASYYNGRHHPRAVV